jgi:hypothetical protein
MTGAATKTLNLGSLKPQEPTWGAPQVSNAVSQMTFQSPQHLIWGPSWSLTQVLFPHTSSSKSHPSLRAHMALNRAAQNALSGRTHDEHSG